MVSAFDLFGVVELDIDALDQVPMCGEEAVVTTRVD
jgi:hypothetical protein